MAALPDLTGICSVSGYRALVGTGINPLVVSALAAIYGSAIAQGGLVVVGRDSRPTGALLRDAAVSALRAVGCEVVDIGVVPTPTVAREMIRFHAAGGIQISASHNPIEWNALKFFTTGGRNIDADELQQLLAAYETGMPAWQDWNAVGSVRTIDDALAGHAQAVHEAAAVAEIRAANITVLLDSVNGAGADLGRQVLTDLGCTVIPVYDRPDQPFPRNPEPTAENVTMTGAMVRAVGAAVGFVQDPDADRLAVIDETGRYIGEEYTLALAAEGKLLAHGQPGAKLGTNLSTSRMLEDVAARHGATVIRTPVGEANVVQAIRRDGALLAGEGNGGVIDPSVVMGRDSHAAMALILGLLAHHQRPLSELIDTWPSYAMIKTKVAISRQQLQESQAALQAVFADDADVELDQRDGLKWSWPDRWVHVRASGTEPVSRIIAEAPSPEQAQALIDAVATALAK
jgi:phosphomannomutase